MIVTLIQTRMKSTRLPGKCMMLMDNIPMTSYTIAAAENSKLTNLHGIIFPESDINTIGKYYDNKLFCYPGSELDVLDRYYKSVLFIEKAINKEVTHIVRLTSDCPLLAFVPSLIDKVIEAHLKNENDFTHNKGENNFPSGFDIEIMTRDLLCYSYKHAKNEEREHVTLYAKRNNNMFKIGGLEKNLKPNNYKFSVDTEEEFKKIELLVQLLNFGNNIMDKWRIINGKQK
jgi:spore coat polysaccharide biosynthesis protein SpsF